MKSWKDASVKEVRELARAWAIDVDERDEETQQAVVLMNFTAPPELQWEYILAAVALAQNEDQLGALAAGPMEHLLGSRGDEYMDQIEALYASSPKFAAMVEGVWQNRMSQANWARIQAIQNRSKE